MFITIKKIILLVLLLIFLTFWISGITKACQLKVIPSTFTAGVEESVEFRLERLQTCGRCKLPLEETKIAITGGQLEGEQVWETGRPDILDFKVSFNQAGPAKITVERICPKSRAIVTADGIIHSGVPEKSQPMDIVEQAGESIAQNTRPEREPSVAEIVPEILGSTEPQPIETNKEIVSNPRNNISVPVENSAQSQVPIWEGKPIVFNILWIWVLIFLAGLVFFLLKGTWARKIILFLSMIGIGFYSGGCPCPVGTIFNYLTGNPLPVLTVILLVAVPLVTTLIWGRFFCGWICPLGAVQELIHFKKIKLPPYFPTIDRTLKFLKYSILAFLTYLAVKTGLNIFCQYEPFKALFNFQGDFITIILLVITLLASVFIQRPFCRYLCPFGAILSFISRFALYKTRLDSASCVGCGVCAKNCPMDALKLAGSERKTPVINYSECIQCGISMNKCRFNALKTRSLFKTNEITNKRPINPSKV